MALKDVQIRQAKPKERPYKLTDGTGLYLEVKAAGKYWRWDYRFHGKRKTFSYGVYPAVSLTKARELHQDAKAILADGVDPMAHKKKKAQADRLAKETVFQDIAKEWQTSKKAGWSDEHIKRVENIFKNHINPEIGEKPIAELTAMEVLEVIRKMENRGLGESCYKALSYINKVCLYATVSGRAAQNVAAGLSDFLKDKPPVKNHRHMEADDLGDFIKKIDGYGGLPQTRIATKLMMLCFMRTNELRQAVWDDIDWDKKQWLIQSENRKGKKALKASGEAHVIPLSRQALELLQELKQHTGHRHFMFEGLKRDTPISENTINQALERIGFGDKQTGHGFRGLASTIFYEHDFSENAVEKQLSHKEKNQVKSAYDHSKRMAERVNMMQWWADYLYSKAGDKVIPIPLAKRA